MLFGKRLSRYKITIFSKNLGGMAPLAPPWLRLWLPTTATRAGCGTGLFGLAVSVSRHFG